MQFFRHYNTLMRFISIVIVVCLGMNVTAYAALVTTPQLSNPEILYSRADLQQLVLREDLQQQLITLGVDPVQIQSRLDSMTNSEISYLSAEISELPAGGDALTTLALVFIVLLVTDILGYTDLFPFVKKNKRSSKKPPAPASRRSNDTRQSRDRSEPIVIEN